MGHKMPNRPWKNTEAMKNVFHSMIFSSLEKYRGYEKCVSITDILVHGKIQRL
jgi:hypothetical protein